jgi:hypothetical protein
MCKRVNLDQFDDIEEAVPFAALDVWEYEMETNSEHEPKGRRTRLSGARRLTRKKNEYLFQRFMEGCTSR